MTDPLAPRRAADPVIQRITGQLRDDIAAATPVDTGLLRDSWIWFHGRNTAVCVVSNAVGYVWPVEFGSKHRGGRVIPPAAMAGRTLAAYRARYSR